MARIGIDKALKWTAMKDVFEHMTDQTDGSTGGSYASPGQMTTNPAAGGRVTPRVGDYLQKDAGFLKWHTIYRTSEDPKYKQTFRSLLSAAPDGAKYGFAPTAGERPISVIALLAYKYPRLFGCHSNLAGTTFVRVAQADLNATNLYSLTARAMHSECPDFIGSQGENCGTMSPNVALERRRVTKHTTATGVDFATAHPESMDLGCGTLVGNADHVAVVNYWDLLNHVAVPGATAADWNLKTSAPAVGGRIISAHFDGRSLTYGALCMRGNTDATAASGVMAGGHTGDRLTEVLRSAPHYGAANFDGLDGMRNAASNADKRTFLLDEGNAYFMATRFMMALANFEYRDVNNLERIAAAVQNGAWLAFDVVLCRPFMEHHMLSTVITVAGADTGATLFGPADMQLSANTATKVIEGHYTCYTKSVITKPRNVLIQRDIMANGYVAGCNSYFFGETGLTNAQKRGAAAKGNIATGRDIQQAIGDRLAFSLDHSEARADVYESILAFLAPHGSTDVLNESAFNLTRRFLPFEVRGEWPRDKMFPGGGQLWAAYNRTYNLDQQILAGEDLQSRESRGFVTGGTNNNSVVFVGPHRTYNYLDKNWTNHTPGQGHWGPDALPGDARVRRGEAVTFEDARSAMRYGDYSTNQSVKSVFSSRS